MVKGLKGEQARLRDLVLTHGDFLARSLRNLGVSGAELDDCVQRVFLVVARRLNDIEVGKERGFLFGCAQNEAAHFRRGLARKREVSDDLVPERSDPTEQPDQLIEQKRYREMLDCILERIDPACRSVFVLYSIEEMTMAEIASLLELPPGTVASRLRRARELFKAEVQLMQKATQKESA